MDGVTSVSKHQIYLSRAIFLARQAGKLTKTNPNVGAVIVHNDNIIGEGYHKAYGGPHAELEALGSVNTDDKAKLSDATIYVTLEPCNHHGKTPPCTQAIIKHKLKHVVVGCLDPTDKVSGKGIARLKDAGINVTVIDSTECKQLIKPFIAHNILKRPYIILKVAQSIDGYIGRHDKEIKLTNQYTNVLTHKWRSEIDGILVGTQTVLTDNPSLTTRHYPGDNPTRITFDNNQNIPISANLFTDGKPSIIFSTKNKPIGLSESVDWITLREGYKLNNVLSVLYEKGIYRLMIEGGSNTITRFVSQDLWDEARIIRTSHVLEEGVKAPTIIGNLISEQTIDSDKILILSRTR